MSRFSTPHISFEARTWAQKRSIPLQLQVFVADSVLLCKQALFGVTNTPILDAWQPPPPSAPLHKAKPSMGWHSSFVSSASQNKDCPAQAPYTCSSASPAKPPAAAADALDSQSGTAQPLQAHSTGAEVQKAVEIPSSTVCDEFSSVFDFL